MILDHNEASKDHDGGAVRPAEIRTGGDVRRCQERRTADASSEGGLDWKAMSLSPRDMLD
jgi:hypothetical protein